MMFYVHEFRLSDGNKTYPYLNIALMTVCPYPSNIPCGGFIKSKPR